MSTYSDSMRAFPFSTFSKFFSPNPSSSDSFLEEAQKKLFQPSLTMLYDQDHKDVFQLKNSVISGYLNLNEGFGWKEGGDPRIGFSFTRYITLEYFFEHKKRFSQNSLVIEKVINAFKNSEGFSSFTCYQNAAPLPKESRICYDSTVMGWDKHCVSRLVGNLGSVYDPSKPFFEILINSARYSSSDASCQPFAISIHANGSELEKRRSFLSSLKKAPADIAQTFFYSTSLQKPEEFLKQHKDKLGENSVRLLNGLAYLQKAPINAQKVGNCWIKQPMRGLLASLYVEIITYKKEVTFDKAWDEAKKIYKDIQKVVAIPFVQNLIQKSDASPKMKNRALGGLEEQKKYL